MLFAQRTTRTPPERVLGGRANSRATARVAHGAMVRQQRPPIPGAGHCRHDSGPLGRQPWDTAARLHTHFAAVPNVAVDNPRQHWDFSSSRAPQGAPPSGNRFSGGPSGVMSEARHHLWLARPQGPIFVNRLGAGRPFCKILRAG